MDTAKIRPVLKQFKRNLADTVPDATFLVWGSYADGTNDDWSDLDVVVVSNNFSSLNTSQRNKLLFKHSLLMDIDIDPWGATPQELATAPVCTYIGLARETGIWVEV